MCLSGYVLARRGVLDKSTQRVGHIFYLPSYPSHSIILQQLNSLNVNFFTPCLLFSKVAFFLSPGPLSITIHLPDSLRLHSRKIARTMDHSHLLLACHRYLTRSGLAARQPFPTETFSKVPSFFYYYLADRNLTDLPETLRWQPRRS